MNKRKITFLIMLMILSVLCVNVYATISGDISLTPSKTTELNAGESFTVTLSLSELSGTTGIDSISGYIDIDENVLEDLTISSIVTDSDGYVEIDDNNILTVYDASDVSSSSSDYGVVLNTSPTSGKGDYRLVIDLSTAVSSGTDLITITFEVKSDATSGTYEDAIIYSSFVIYEGTSNKYAMDDKSVDITIVDGTSSSSSDDDSNNTTNDTSNNTSNDTSNNTTTNSTNNSSDTNSSSTSGTTSSSNSSTTTDNTTASGTLPYTGFKLIMLPIAAVLVAGIVFCRKYNKYKDVK